VNINREPVEYLLLMWFTNTWDQNSQMIRPNVGLWVSDIEKNAWAKYNHFKPVSTNAHVSIKLWLWFFDVF
jgi:hypothetical protein